MAAPFVDHYEILQISVGAEPDTIHRVYRMLAMRFHPDNRDTGNKDRFQEVSDAYGILSDPALRAQYDVLHDKERRSRWRVVTEADRTDDHFEIEKVVRMTLLELLYTRLRLEPSNRGIYRSDLEEMLGRPREQLDFTIWYLSQKNLIALNDDSQLTITIAGVDFFEEHQQGSTSRRRLRAHDGSKSG